MRFGLKYLQAQPLLQTGFENLRGTIGNIFAEQQRRDDEEFARRVLTRTETRAPIVGDQEIDLPPELGGRIKRIAMYGDPTTHTRFKDPYEMDPTDISALLMQGSGEGARALNAYQVARSFGQPRQELDVLPKGGSIWDKISGRIIASDPEAPGQMDFGKNRLPYNLQVALDVLGNMDAQMEERQLAQKLLQAQTGQQFPLAKKIPGAEKLDYRTANGATYSFDAKGNPTLRIPADPREAIKSEMDTLNNTRAQGGINRDRYKARMARLEAELDKLNGLTPNDPSSEPSSDELEFISRILNKPQPAWRTYQAAPQPETKLPKW